MARKKELHIKRVTGGFMCCVKEDIWRGYSGVKPSMKEALEVGYKIIKSNPKEFLKDICNCGTGI